MHTSTSERASSQMLLKMLAENKNKNKSKLLPNLKQAVNLASLGVDVDVEISRRRGKTWDRLDIRS